MASPSDDCFSTEEESLYLPIQEEDYLKSKGNITYSGTLPQKTASANEKDISFPVHMDQTVSESSSSELNVLETKLFPESPDSDCKTISSEDEKQLHHVNMDQMVPEFSTSNVPGTEPFPESPDSHLICKTTSRSDRLSDDLEHSDNADQDPMVSENSSNAPENEAFVDESEQPMSEPMRKAVNAQRPQLSRKVIWENIKIELHVDAGGFLNDDEEEEIDACKTNKEKMNLVLKYLRTKNKKAFTSFCGALVSSGYHYFALKLSEEAGVNIGRTMAQRQMNTGKDISKKKSGYDWEPVLTSLREPYNKVWSPFQKFILEASDNTFYAVRGDYLTSFAVKQKVSRFSKLVPMKRIEFLEHARMNTTFFDIRVVRDIAFGEHCKSSALTEAVQNYEALLKPLMSTAIHDLTDRCKVKPISEDSREGAYKLVLRFPDDANVQDLYDAKAYLEKRLEIEEAKLLAFDFGCILVYFEISCSPDQLEALWEKFTAHSEQWEDLGIDGAYLVNHWSWEAKETPPSCALVRKRTPSQTGGPVCKFSESRSTDMHSMQLGHMEDGDQSDHSCQVSSEDEEELFSLVNMDQTVPEPSRFIRDVLETEPFPNLPDSATSTSVNDEQLDDKKKQMDDACAIRSALIQMRAAIFKLEQQIRPDQFSQEVKRQFSEIIPIPHKYASGTPPHHGYAYVNVRHKTSDEMIRSSSDSSLRWRTVGNTYYTHGISIENLDFHPLSIPLCGEGIPIPSQVKFHQASSRGVLELNDDKRLPLSECYEQRLHDCEEFLSSVEDRGKHDAALEELIAHVKKKISSLRTELEKSITKLQDVLDPHHGTRNS